MKNQQTSTLSIQNWFNSLYRTIQIPEPQIIPELTCNKKEKYLMSNNIAEFNFPISVARLTVIITKKSAVDASLFSLLYLPNETYRYLLSMRKND